MHVRKDNRPSTFFTLAICCTHCMALPYTRVLFRMHLLSVMGSSPPSHQFKNMPSCTQMSFPIGYTLEVGKRIYVMLT